MNRSRALIAACTVSVLAGAPVPARAEALRASTALTEAMGNTPTLRAAIEDAAGAQALVASEDARYDPTLKVTVGVDHTKSPSLSPGGGVLVGTSDIAQAEATLSKKLDWGTELYATVGTTTTRSSTPLFLGSAQTGAQPLVLTLGPGYLFSAKVGVTQPLLRGAGQDVTLAAYRQAMAQNEATHRERDRQASALARDLLVAYWELWYASRSLEVDRLARETARAQRDDALARMQTGSLARADVLTFETQLATKDETVAQSELERESRANELARLLGRSDARLR